MKHVSRAVRAFMLAISLVAMPAAIAGPAGAAVIHVPGDHPAIQPALDAAAYGDSILVDPGIYEGPDNTRLDYSGKEISLIGVEGPEATIIESSWDPGDYCVDFDEGEGPGALLKGFTLRGAQVLYYGGAAYCGNGSSPTIEDVVFTGNTGSVGYPNDAYGGGLYVDLGCAPRLIRCDFIANWAGFGAAVFTEGAPVFEEVRFERNEGQQGGAVLVYRGSATFTRCVFADNEANAAYTDDVVLEAGKGGAVYLRSGTTSSFTDCLFARNVAEACGPGPESNPAPGKGGAILGTSVSPRLTHCTFYGNVAEPWESQIGGILHLGGLCTPILDACIVAASPQGPGIFCGETSIPEVTCCDFWDNPDGNYAGGIDDQTGLNGNIAGDPIFCDVAGDDFSVSYGSPCLPAWNECGVQMGAFGEGCDLVSDAAETPPLALELAQNHPNPFNPDTEIRFGLPALGAVTLRVLDASGRTVATLLDDAALPAGWHRVVWRGRDDAGHPAASGLYFYRLDTGEAGLVRKMLLLK